MPRRSHRFAAATLFVFMAAAACHPDASAQLRTFATDEMHLIYYNPAQEYLLDHMGRSFTNAMHFHENLFDYRSGEKVTVFLHDNNDYGTGGASTIPWNFLNIGIEPYDYVYETVPTNERMNWVFMHELAHLVAVDKATASDRFFRSLFFGKVLPVAEHPESMFYSFLTTPRWYSPRWYHEGIATFLETWMAGGIGRVQGGYDEMKFRTMVADSSYFYDFVGIESEGTTIDFQIGANAYLYGTRFVSYVALQHGSEKIIEWFNRTEGSNAYFESRFEQVFGSSLDDEWSRWIEWEHQWQTANLDVIRNFVVPVTPYRPLSATPLGSVSRAFYDSARGKLYCGVNYPGEVAHLAEIDVRTGEKRKLTDVPTPALYYVTSLAYDSDAGTLFYTLDNSRDWRDIHAYDLKTGESRELFHDCRIGDLVINPSDKTLWGVQHFNGISTLMRMPPPYTYRYEVLELGYGNDIFDLDISPDGRTLMAVLLEISGRQKLITMDIDSLIAGSRAHKVVLTLVTEDSTWYSPANFVFTPDGNSVWGTSYFSGVSNVLRLNLETEYLDALSNTETGFFRPLPYTADSLIAFRFTGNGFLPVAMPLQPVDTLPETKFLGNAIYEKDKPLLDTWVLGPPSPDRINIDSLTTYRGDYVAFGDIGVASLYPVVEGYKDVYAVGLAATLSDPLPLHFMNLSASYTPNQALPPNERFHAFGEYYYRFWKFTAGYNSADFYDLFGPTKTGRKGYAASIGYGDRLLEERPSVVEYGLTLSGYADLDRLPDYQNVEAPLDRFLNFSGRLTFTRQLRTLGANDYEKGMKAGLFYSTKYARERFYPRLHATFDMGFILWDHASLWLRTAGGHSFGSRSDPMVKYYFGGFGNNWIDHGEIRRYREFYSFPGAEINDLGGSNFVKGTVELDLPPLRFRRIGLPIAYANWARLALFSTGLMTNVGDDLLRRRAVSVGAQIDLKLVLFSNQESTLSWGYASAFSPTAVRSDEWMISLKILR